MYGQHPFNDGFRFLRAAFTNQVAKLMPRAYLKWSGQTGRGNDEESPREIADYFETLNIERADICNYLSSKRVLEYGPGDVPGVALLMYAHGADVVFCLDHFPLASLTRKNIEALRVLIGKLDGDVRARADDAFNAPGLPESGFNIRSIKYIVRRKGLSGLGDEVDLVLPRAALEHVGDLPAIFQDMQRAMRRGGIAVHKVDLGSHGLHLLNPLDFLTWPQRHWSLMYGHKGYPNRWRVNKYRELVQETGFVPVSLEPTKRATHNAVVEVRPHLASMFAELSNEDLSWLGFWLIMRKV